MDELIRWFEASRAAPGSGARGGAIALDFCQANAKSGREQSGSAQSAIDLAWAAFAALIRPLPQEHCSMSDTWRSLYTWEPMMTSAQTVGALLQRRDRVYAAHLRLPVVVV